MPHLPPEILSHILSYLPTKPSSAFLQLSLTSKAFHSVANEFLYRAPYVKSEIHLNLLGSTLEANKELAAMVRELYIDWNSAQELSSGYKEALKGLLVIVKGMIQLSVTNGILRCFGDMLQSLDQLERLSFDASFLEMNFRHPSTPPLPSVRFLVMKNVTLFTQFNERSFSSTFVSLTSFSFLSTKPRNLGYDFFSPEFLLALPSSLTTLRICLGSTWDNFPRERNGNKREWEAALQHFHHLEVFESDFKAIWFDGEERLMDEEVDGGLFRLLTQHGKLQTVGFYFQCDGHDDWEDAFVPWLQLVLRSPTSFLSSVQKANLYFIDGGSWDNAKKILLDQTIEVNLILGTEGQSYKQNILNDPTWGLS